MAHPDLLTQIIARKDDIFQSHQDPAEARSYESLRNIVGNYAADLAAKQSRRNDVHLANCTLTGLNLEFDTYKAIYNFLRDVDTHVAILEKNPIDLTNTTGSAEHPSQPSIIDLASWISLPTYAGCPDFPLRPAIARSCSRGASLAPRIWLLAIL